MNYFEVSNTHFDDFRKEYFPRNSLPPKIIHLRKVSQENHVKRMKLAYQKNHLKVRDDLNSSVSRFSISRRTSSLKAPFATEKLPKNDIYRNLSEKHMSSSFRVRRNDALTVRMHYADVDKHSNETSSVRKLSEKSSNITKSKGSKSNTGSSFINDEKSSSKDSPSKAGKNKAKSKTKSKKTKSVKKKHKNISDDKPNIHSSSEINKNTPEYDENTSASGNKSQNGTPKSTRTNISNQVQVDNFNPSSYDDGKKENDQLPFQNAENKNSERHSDKKIFRLSKIPVSISRMSIKRDQGNITFPLSNSPRNTETPIEFSQASHEKHDSKSKSDSKVLVKQTQIKQRRNVTLVDRTSQTCSRNFTQCTDISMNNSPQLRKQSRKLEKTLDIVPDKMSSVSLWLESIDTNNTEYIKGLDEADLLSQRSNEKSSASNIKSSKSSFTRSSLKNENSEGFEYVSEDAAQENIRKIRCNQKAQDKFDSGLSDQSFEYYYDFDDTEDDILKEKSQKLYVDHMNKWKEDICEEITIASSGSLFNSELKTAKNKNTKKISEKLATQHNCTPPYNLRFPRYKLQERSVLKKAESGINNSPDAKIKSNVTRKKSSSSTPKRKKITKSKKNQKIKK